MPLFRRRRADDVAGIAPRRPHPGLLRRERRLLLKAREDALRDLGGLAVEMYRRGGFRDDLLAERCAGIVGIDARLAEIEGMLHGQRHVARCQCGAPDPARLALLPELRPAARPGGGERLGRERGDHRRAGARAVSTTEQRDREAAIAAADGTCPRCGAPREPDQSYCLECGLALPAVSGRVPALRRRWLRRIGWYPGDWVWVSLLTLVVAIVGTVASILLTRQRATAGPTFTTAPPVVSVKRADDAEHDHDARDDDPDDDYEEAAEEAARNAERPTRLARAHERLDDRARLVPEDDRPCGRTSRRPAARRNRA